MINSLFPQGKERRSRRDKLQINSQ